MRLFVGSFKHEILSHGMYLYRVFFVEPVPREIFFVFANSSRSDENEEDCFARLLSKHKSQLISSLTGTKTSPENQD